MSKKTPKKRQYIYDYPRPAVTVDLVVVTREERPRVLLIRRAKEPFAGMWALPGGFVDENEPLEAAARRELFEETGVRAAELEEIGAFGDPGRDPRGWTISIAFLARIDPGAARAKAGDDAAEADLHDLDNLTPLAFDHANILIRTRDRLLSARRTTRSGLGN